MVDIMVFHNNVWLMMILALSVSKQGPRMIFCSCIKLPKGGSPLYYLFNLIHQ